MLSWSLISTFRPRGSRPSNPEMYPVAVEFAWESWLVLGQKLHCCPFMHAGKVRQYNCRTNRQGYSVEMA